MHLQKKEKLKNTITLKTQGIILQFFLVNRTQSTYNIRTQSGIVSFYRFKLIKKLQNRSVKPLTK